MNVNISISDTGWRTAHNPPRTDCLYLTLIRCTLRVYSRSRYWPSLAKSRTSLAADTAGALITETRAAVSFSIISEVSILATFVWFRLTKFGISSIHNFQEICSCNLNSRPYFNFLVFKAKESSHRVVP